MSKSALATSLEKAPRFRCAHLPTPLQPLERLSAHLGGARIWLKRDDCTGLATGGNKARKLEYLVGDAIARGADTLITQGAVQSNHVRQTAAAAAMASMACEVLYEQRVDNPDPDYASSGNVLLTRMLGATQHQYPKDTDMDDAMQKVAEKLRDQGAKPYIIAGGGSDPVGASGYANCVLEIMAQAAQLQIQPSCLVHATGSTGTQAGLVAGCFGLGAPFGVLGISVRLAREPQEEKVYQLARATLRHLGVTETLPREKVRANGDYVGDGYGLPTDSMLEAVSLLARLEGILLDPVYSGKGMAGLIDLVRQGAFAKDEDIVFIHTGGAAALFGYRSIFDADF